MAPEKVALGVGAAVAGFLLGRIGKGAKVPHPPPPSIIAPPVVEPEAEEEEVGSASGPGDEGVFTQESFDRCADRNPNPKP